MPLAEEATTLKQERTGFTEISKHWQMKRSPGTCRIHDMEGAADFPGTNVL
jgi:hypothetical protein